MNTQELDYKYKEMVRLAEVLEQYSRSAFDDFKLLSAVGVLLAFQPASSFFEIKSDIFLIAGFLAILSIIAFIGFYGLMKQSIAVFYLNEISKFEKEFREGLSAENTEMESFKVAENWKFYGSKKQQKVARIFYSLFYLVITFVPTGVLYTSTNTSQAALYGLSAALVSGLHLYTVKKVYIYD